MTYNTFAFFNRTAVWENIKKIEVDRERSIYFVFSFQDRIDKYNNSLEEIWHLTLLGNKKIKSRKTDDIAGLKEIMPSVPTKICYKDIAFDNHGNLFILGGHLSVNPSKDVYVLNKDGEYLTTFTLDEKSHCIHIDDNNYLYSRGGEGTSIKKYAMEYSF